MKISLFIIDNGHTLMESNIGTSMMTHIEQFRLPASRLVISTAEILKGVKDKSLKFLCRQIQRMVTPQLFVNFFKHSWLKQDRLFFSGIIF